MNSTVSIDAVLQAAHDRYSMQPDGIHGFAHWERVRTNGLLVAKHHDADIVVVELFAYLHDCCRESDGRDLQHGPRAARFAESLRESILSGLSDIGFRSLVEACEGHTFGMTEHESETVLACWDADRLDLGRIGVRPDPRYLCTEFARRAATIQEAYERSLVGRAW